MNPVVISPQRNANNFVVNCISSVAQQSIVPRHIIIDDCSSDETAKILSDVASRYSHTEVVLNDDRKYRLENIYDTVQSLCDDDVVLLLDGDDWFGYTNVVEKVLEKYSDQRVEYVYTNWQYSHAPILGISKKIPGSDWEPYSSPWITSAMGTFRARWFKKIPKANFLDENGNFFKMGTDQAYILPMLHMLKERDGDYRGVQFIDEPLYVYQFVENEMRRRIDAEGQWERKTANDSSRLIRSRGFVSG
jgi:glycosyltransferase involved in cell wall biosynthesis